MPHKHKATQASARISSYTSLHHPKQTIKHHPVLPAELASDDDDDEDEQAAKAARGEEDGDVAQQRRVMREARAARVKEVVDYYHQGSSYGKPTALLLYELLRGEAQENTHLLW
jgi:hypothetical protein